MNEQTNQITTYKIKSTIKNQEIGLFSFFTIFSLVFVIVRLSSELFYIALGLTVLFFAGVIKCIMEYNDEQKITITPDYAEAFERKLNYKDYTFYLSTMKGVPMNIMCQKKVDAKPGHYYKVADFEKYDYNPDAIISELETYITLEPNVIISRVRLN